MGLLLVVAVVVVLAFCVLGIGTCPAQGQKGLTVEKLNQILNEAKQRNGSGTMHLQGYGRGPSSQGYPIAEWPPGTEVIRAPEGGTLLIPCNNTNNSYNTQRVYDIRKPPAYARNDWQVPLIRDIEVVSEGFQEVNHCCNLTKDHNPAEFIMHGAMHDRTTGAFSIALPNFTYAATGLYECQHFNGSQYVVTQRYWVSATLFRHNVFNLPMKNVTVRYGDPAEMVCAVRFNFLPGRLRTRFLWRAGNYLLVAKSISEVADKAMSWWGFNGRFEFSADEEGRCSSTMKIDSATWKDAGLYECWFRINDRLDEWIMQEAYLHVI
ncbi:uncharacterized protein LOC129592846 isoform X2 [Paramacrobiotus metropolitanus]|uniref:uncharacterized protein LOC129592846 isoform X2 n=1 Tax=Paramacrobiotus metropolitanus TaxID=2943436 RepID=UPI0024459E34|nr:uncharacterized protein LOC129592846 isoform X2 [Paramacrobiotus metropolitanus]XP_055344952.1 uncharacterized protein LOC129592846 isoform X2 [Paramacrobiotus metropolitanus]